MGDETDVLPGSEEEEEAEDDRKEAKRLRKSERKEQKRLFAKEQRQQRNKAQKQRKQELRKEKLESMSAEERAEFLEKERQAGRDRKAFLETSLTEAFERGRPRVVVNCSFDQSMDVKELTSLAKQIQLAYTQARNMGSKVQLHLTSVCPENRAMRALEAQGVKSWKMHVHEKSVWEVFRDEARSGQLVILSPDAEEELTEVLEDEIYVIGGIVDRSVKKMQSLTQAQEFGAKKLRRLPLKTFGPKGCCPVLNVDCVPPHWTAPLAPMATEEWRIAEMEREPLDASERSETEDLDDMLVIQKLCGGQREAIALVLLGVLCFLGLLQLR